MLENAGILAALYTDSSSLSLLGRLACLLGPNAPQKMQRLARRSISGVSKFKVFSTDYPLIKKLITKMGKRKSEGVSANKEYGDWLACRMIREGLKGANIIYSMNCSCLDFVSYAKSRGCKSVIDTFMHPKTEDIYSEEYRRWPEFGYVAKNDDSLLWRDLWQRAFDVADILLCPSEWVAEGILEIAPYAKGKIRVVPYGCTIDYGGRVNHPIVGRIFFAGGNALGKGLPYLAEAATRLRNEIPGLDVRIAGQLPSDVATHFLCKDLNFLGKLSSEQMKEEYLSADLFVLPSLTEGFAGVIAEAICAGCPVIVTREAGSPIVNGREGAIVEARDANALVKYIEKIVKDRKLRNDMSKACLEQIPFYSEAAWQKRLIAAITS